MRDAESATTNDETNVVMACLHVRSAMPSAPHRPKTMLTPLRRAAPDRARTVARSGENPHGRMVRATAFPTFVYP